MLPYSKPISAGASYVTDLTTEHGPLHFHQNQPMWAAQTLGLTMPSPTSAGTRAYALAGWNLVARATRLQSGTSVWAGDQASTEGHCRVPASLPHSINTAKGLSTNLLQSMPYNQWSDTHWAAFIIRDEPHNSNTPSAHGKVLSANPTVNAAQESHTTRGPAFLKRILQYSWTIQ